MKAETAQPDAADEQRPEGEVEERAAVTPIVIPLGDVPEPPKAATRAEIAEIVPRGLEAVGERCLIEGKTLEQTRGILLEEHTRRHPPVNMLEPDEPTYRAPGAAAGNTQAAPKPKAEPTTRDYGEALTG